MLTDDTEAFTFDPLTVPEFPVEDACVVNPETVPVVPDTE